MSLSGSLSNIAHARAVALVACVCVQDTGLPTIMMSKTIRALIVYGKINVLSIEPIITCL